MGGNVTASVSVSGTGPFTYQWYKDSFSTPVASQTAATLSLTNVTATDQGSYSVVVTGAYSATSTAFSLTSNALPTVALSTTNICLGSPLTLSATSGLSNYTFTSSSGLIGSGPANTTSVAGLAATTHSFTVTAQDANSSSNTATTSATVNTLPTASLLASGTITCANPGVTLTANGGVSYTFTNADGTLGTPGSVSALVVQSPDTYSVAVASADGCVSTTSTTVESNTTAVTVSLVNSNSLNCAVTSATITATATGVGSLTYAFTGGNLTGSPSTNSTVTVNQPGTYTVLVTGANGCTNTATTTVTSVTAAPTGLALTASNSNTLTR